MNTTPPSAVRPEHLLNITIKQIKAFLAAVEHKNFSRAARQVFMSQPAFSRSIQDLEDELGEAVFARSPQGVILTNFGKAFLPQAHKLVASFKEVQTDITHWRADQHTQLRLAGSASVMHMALPALLARFNNEYPDGSLLFDAMSSAQVVSQVVTGHAAMGVCTLTHEQLDLISRPVLRAPLGLLMASDFELPCAINSVADLDYLPLIRFHDDSVITQTLKSNAIACNAYFNSKVITCGVPGVFQLTRQGDHVILASGFGASHPQAADLRFVPLPRLLPTIEVAVVGRRDKADNFNQQIMKDLVRASLLETTWHVSVEHAAGKAVF